LTFSQAEPAGRRQAKLKIARDARDRAKIHVTLIRIDDLFLAETEQFPLFSPAGREPRRQTHQCLGGELRRFSAIDDGRGDVGCQPGKTQKGIEVGCRHAFLASDVMHAELGVMDQARLDVVRARKDSEQARIGCHLVIGILDQHSHFAADALQDAPKLLP